MIDVLALDFVSVALGFGVGLLYLVLGLQLIMFCIDRRVLSDAGYTSGPVSSALLMVFWPLGLTFIYLVALGVRSRIRKARKQGGL